MAATKEAALEASRLGALLSTLQSAEYMLESVATRLAGESGGWTVITLLEVWRTVCRLRLLSLMPRGSHQRLIRSVASEEPYAQPRAESWSSVIGRISADSQLRLRASRSASPTEGANGQRVLSTSWPSARSTGELLHTLQPLLYLLMLAVWRARARRHRTSTCASVPWLTALAIEMMALHLCSRGVGSETAAELPGSRRGEANAALQREEADELEHRRKLIMLFLLRPAARAAIRILLMRFSLRVSKGSMVGGWIALALELVDSLDTSCAYRYFRIQAQLPETEAADV